MDWQRLNDATRLAQTLSVQELEPFLAELRGNSPEVEAAVTTYLSRAGQADSFMQTSVGSTASGADARDGIEIGARVGPWKVTELLGTGGMGQVFKAQRDDGLYDQSVALKVMAGAEADRRARFDRERQRLAQLDHPGISRIIDGGTFGADQRPYMAMELVTGQTIDRHVDGAALGLRDRLRLFCELCDAVSYVHGKLTLHRDIKASNVMVDEGGKVRLLDFGVAALLDDDELESAGPLTLAYAAPEQLFALPLSAATDQFALGVLLHQLLAGEPPGREADGSVTVLGQASRNPELRAILERATAFEPAARYGTVAALSDDVRAFLAAEPVAAVTGGPFYRLRKLAQRAPVAVGLGVALVLALAAGLITSVQFAQQAGAEAERARAALAESQFNLEASERWLGAQSAYADALQRLFGASGDVEAQTRALFDVWREAHELRDKSPAEADQAAKLGYSIGRHFVFRNDYETGRRILEAWVQEGYGDPGILMLGKHVLGIAYASSGDGAAAEPLLREVEAWYGSSYAAETADHIAAANQLAMITQEPDDLARAEALLRAGIEASEDLSTNAYFYNQLARMLRNAGRFQEAYEALQDALAGWSAVRAGERAGHDTLLLNIAQYEVFFTRDLDRAEALAQKVLTEDSAERGINRETGWALATRGQVEAFRGDPAAGERLLREGLTVIGRFTTSAAPMVVDTQAFLGEVLAEQNSFAAARALLEPLFDGPAQDPASYNYQRVMLALLYVDALAEGVQRAQARCSERLVSPGQLARYPQFVFLWERLVALGVGDRCLRDG
ncbi:MAG: serine/threonine-protein kinase [Pseudomonadota bacterium]